MSTPGSSVRTTAGFSVMTTAMVTIIAISWVRLKRLSFAVTESSWIGFSERLKLCGGRKMTRAAKTSVTNDGVKGFFERARERARKLDRREPLVPEIVVSFEDASELLRVLSSERVRLLSVAKKRPTSVSDLASDLNRDARAVSRDVDLLESFGLLRTRYEANPGHGKRRIVEPRASQYKLVASI